jgi:hypothetical protein
MGKKVGNLILLKIDDKVIEALTTNSFESERDMIECTNKLTSFFKDFQPGEMTSTVPFEGKYRDDITLGRIGLMEIMGLYQTGAKVEWIMGGTEIGDEIIQGEGYISNMTWDAPLNEITMFSGTIQVVGEWFISVVS